MAPGVRLRRLQPVSRAGSAAPGGGRLAALQSVSYGQWVVPVHPHHVPCRFSRTVKCVACNNIQQT